MKMKVKIRKEFITDKEEIYYVTSYFLIILLVFLTLMKSISGNKLCNVNNLSLRFYIFPFPSSKSYAIKELLVNRFRE